MKRLSDVIQQFCESEFAQVIREFSDVRSTIQPWEIKWVATITLVPLLTLVFFVLNMNLQEKKKARLRAKGTYDKEEPIETVEIKHIQRKEIDSKTELKHNETSISLTYKIKKKRTANAAEISAVKAENERRKKTLYKGTLSLIPKDEICLIARSASVYNLRNNGEIKAEEERNRSFRLDISYSWEKKKNEEWLAGENTVCNEAGEIIGVRGISEKTSELGYDIFIPKVEEKELLKMGSDELLKFCEPENCKLQVREGGSKISFSDIPGYTKADVIKAIREAAEAQGIKVKIKK